MKLLIDIGNTRVKYAFIESGRLTDSQVFNRSKTGIKASLNSHFKTIESVDAIFVSNVAGDKIAQQLLEWAEKKWKVTPTFVQSEKKRFGVTNAYADVSALGVDRWLALIAARQHARMATCIIDCGTAITVDIVTKYGLHQGGMILPGLGLMRQSLLDNTSDLNETLEESEFKTLAVNTQSAIQAGTLYTVTATLERLISDLKDQFKQRIRFIITGGDAELLLPLLPESIAHYPDIVLKGLAYYARQSDKRRRQDTKPNTTVDVTAKADAENTQMETTEVKSTEVETVEVKSAEVETTEVETAEVKSAEVKSAEVKSAEVETAEVETAEVETAEVETAEVETAEVETAEVETAEVETTEVETVEVETAEVETANG